MFNLRDLIFSQSQYSIDNSNAENNIISQSSFQNDEYQEYDFEIHDSYMEASNLNYLDSKGKKDLSNTLHEENEYSDSDEEDKPEKNDNPKNEFQYPHQFHIRSAKLKSLPKVFASIPQVSCECIIL